MLILKTVFLTSQTYEEKAQFQYQKSISKINFKSQMQVGYLSLKSDFFFDKV
jgi:hypothetical protein